MLRLYITPITVKFWASPHESMSRIANWGAVRSERNSLAIKVVDPGILRLAGPGSPAPRPLPDYPTDVPAPAPHDVPVPEPIDPPVPEPGKPPATDPSKQPDPKPKTRPVP